MKLRKEICQAAHGRERIIGLENSSIIKDQEELTPVLHARTNLKSGDLCGCHQNKDGSAWCSPFWLEWPVTIPSEESAKINSYCQNPW